MHFLSRHCYDVIHREILDQRDLPEYRDQLDQRCHTVTLHQTMSNSLVGSTW